MQIKLRKNSSNVQLLRAVYDSVTQRTRQVSLGSFNSKQVTAIGDLPARISTALHTNELDQLNIWFNEQSAKNELDSIRERISNSGQTISDIAAALDSAEPMTADQRKSLLDAIPGFNRALRNRGITKSDIISNSVDKIIAAIRSGTPDSVLDHIRTLCKFIVSETVAAKRIKSVVRLNDLIAELHRTGQLHRSVTPDDFFESAGVVE